MAKSSLAACSMSGRTLTMQFSARTEAQFLLYGPLPGDVLLDDQTGTVFFVHSRAGTTVLAQAQNNYKPAGGGSFAMIAPVSTTGGNLYWRSSRLYTPTWYLRGDTTAGSAVIANCGRDDGHAAWFDAEVAVGDAVAVIPTQDNWVSPTVVTVAARDQAAGTITLSGSAGMRTQARRRLDLFARAAPASDAAP